MNKLLTTALCLLTAPVFAQTMPKETAKSILQKSWTCVKQNDSASFARLWSLDDVQSRKHRRPHTTREINENLEAVREWMSEAITRDLKIDHIDMEPSTLPGTDVSCWIQAWFRYNGRLRKGYGFYMALYDGKWVARDYPSTSQRHTD